MKLLTLMRISLPAIALVMGAPVHSVDESVSSLLRQERGADLPSFSQRSSGGGGGRMYPRKLEQIDGKRIRDSVNGSNEAIADLLIQRAALRRSTVEEPPSRMGPGNVGFEFDSLVEQTVGIRVPLFGQKIFSDGNFSDTATEIAPSADYVIGPGDQIAIRSWGQVDIDVVATVSREGRIFIPKVGELAIAGKRADALDSTIKGLVRQYFRNFELSATLIHMRSVPVYVTGKAREPGLHRVPALSTMIHAIFSIAAPTRHGNLREIELKRGGRLVARLDLYRFLVYGDKSGDVPIRAGDVIHIPPGRGQAAVVGSVKSPAIFQLNKTDTLGELLDFAGGLTTSGSKRRIVIERTNQAEQREVVELNDGVNVNAYKIHDGDIVTILPKSPRIGNSVVLRGNVATPIRGAWFPGMRISDLIPDASALMLPAYWMTRNRETGHVMLFDDKHVKDATPKMQQINWEFALIERLNKNTLSPALISFNLRLAVQNKDPVHNHLLQSGDTITVFSLEDFDVRENQRQRFVRVEGEVGRAGLYQLNPGETLPSLIERVGGFTERAYPFGMSLRRESVRELQQSRMDETVLKLEQETYRLLSVNARSIAGEDAADALPVQLEALRSLIEKLKEVKASGRIILEAPTRVRESASLPAYTLEDGDTVYVPPIPTVVSVTGSVYQEGPILYKPDRTVQEYVKLSGGKTRNAHDEPPIVLRADGSIVVEEAKDWSFLQSVNGMTLMPGDTIVVRENLDQVKWSKSIRDWTQVIYQFGLGAASLFILRGL